MKMTARRGVRRCLNNAVKMRAAEPKTIQKKNTKRSLRKRSIYRSAQLKYFCPFRSKLLVVKLSPPHRSDCHRTPRSVFPFLDLMNQCSGYRVGRESARNGTVGTSPG